MLQEAVPWGAAHTRQRSHRCRPSTRLRTSGRTGYTTVSCERTQHKTANASARSWAPRDRFGCLSSGSARLGLMRAETTGSSVEMFRSQMSMRPSAVTLPNIVDTFGDLRRSRTVPRLHDRCRARSLRRASTARVRERLVLRRKGGRYVIVYTCPRACTRHQCGMRTEQPVQRERAHNGEDDTSGSRRLEMALQVYGAC